MSGRRRALSVLAALVAAVHMLGRGVVVGGAGSVEHPQTRLVVNGSAGTGLADAPDAAFSCFVQHASQLQCPSSRGDDQTAGDALFGRHCVQERHGLEKMAYNLLGVPKGRPLSDVLTLPDNNRLLVVVNSYRSKRLHLPQVLSNLRDMCNAGLTVHVIVVVEPQDNDTGRTSGAATTSPYTQASPRNVLPGYVRCNRFVHTDSPVGERTPQGPHAFQRNDWLAGSPGFWVATRRVAAGLGEQAAYVHRQIVYDHREHYDLFAYMEDDIGLQLRHLQTFLVLHAVTPGYLLPGFIRTTNAPDLDPLALNPETDSFDATMDLDTPSRYHWIRPNTLWLGYNSSRYNGPDTTTSVMFPYLTTNVVHAGLWVLHKSHVKHMVDIGCFNTEFYGTRWYYPHGGYWDSQGADSGVGLGGIREAAASELYVFCGKEKVYPTPFLMDLTVEHYDNRLIDKVCLRQAATAGRAPPPPPPPPPAGAPPPQSPTAATDGARGGDGARCADVTARPEGSPWRDLGNFAHVTLLTDVGNRSTSRTIQQEDLDLVDVLWLNRDNASHAQCIHEKLDQAAAVNTSDSRSRAFAYTPHTEVRGIVESVPPSRRKCETLVRMLHFCAAHLDNEMCPSYLGV